MKHRSYILVLSLLTLATLSIAQDQRETSAKAQERITREVRHELLMLPYFGVFDNIAFKVDGYNVTLLGQVVRPSLKSDAENAVKHIEGVEKIDNQIEVLPPSTTDDSLRLALYRAIYGYPALEKYALGVQKPIRIIVKNGHVTLEGVVDSDADKNMAGLRAKCRLVEIRYLVDICRKSDTFPRGRVGRKHKAGLRASATGSPDSSARS